MIKPIQKKRDGTEVVSVELKLGYGFIGFEGVASNGIVVQDVVMTPKAARELYTMLHRLKNNTESVFWQEEPRVDG